VIDKRGTIDPANRMQSLAPNNVSIYAINTLRGACESDIGWSGPYYRGWLKY
jgi:hypothetical protein